MSLTAILVMILICGAIWGGFAALLLLAARREGQKGGDGD